MKKHLSTILLVAALLGGLGLLLYPTFSNYWNSFHQSQAIAGYAEAVAGLTQADYERFWNAARAYNVETAERGNLAVLTDERREEYLQHLDVGGNGIMGYIEIPKINVSLPIYHGTGDTVLQIAVGHLETTSLPVGGASTHAVLSGHRGLPSARLFTDLDDLNPGDVFLLRILNETLTYQIDQIHIVLPEQVDDLQIIEGRDLCTLVTCTPYGINSHRMLVRGTRIENQDNTGIRVTADAIRIDPILVAPFTAIPMLIILLIVLLSTTGRKKKKPAVPSDEDGEAPEKPKRTRKVKKPKGGKRTKSNINASPGQAPPGTEESTGGAGETEFL